MTRQCNYRCSYCYYPHVPPPVRDALPTEDLVRFLDGTGKHWLVGMTGGEPLLYPDFVSLCKRLCENHSISIDTNLSLSKKVRDFVDRLAPDRVQELYVSLHIQERERHGGVQDFVDNVALLHDAGFTVIVNYVLHPELVHRFADDRQFFAEQGITLRPRPFKGAYEGRRYPEAYSEAAKEMLALHPGAGTKMVYDFHGVPCEGGRSFIRMEPDGTVFRCSGEKKVMGTVTRGVTLHSRAEPCGVHRCPCRGLDYVLLTSAQQAFLRGLQLGLLGQAEQARAAYDQALRLDPAYAGAYNNTGVLLWQENQRQRALDCFTNARAHQPEEGLFLFNTALALACQGKTSEARQHCRAFLDRHEDKLVRECYAHLEHQNALMENAPRLCLRVHSGRPLEFQL